MQFPRLKGKKKSVFNNQIRRAVQKARVFLKENGLYSGDSLNKIALAFADYLGVEIDCHPQEWLVNLWRTGENDIIKKTDLGFYMSPEWGKLRREVLKKYGAVCMKCGSVDHVHVDHIKPRSLYPALELEFDNLQVLCRPCNSSKSNRVIADYR